MSCAPDGDQELRPTVDSRPHRVRTPPFLPVLDHQWSWPPFDHVAVTTSIADRRSVPKRSGDASGAIVSRLSHVDHDYVQWHPRCRRVDVGPTLRGCQECDRAAGGREPAEQSIGRAYSSKVSGRWMSMGWAFRAGEVLAPPSQALRGVMDVI
jgi:hypothetical protein